MKKYLFLALILTGVLLTKSCCFKNRETIYVDYGTLEDSTITYVPYKDFHITEFLDTNGVKVQFITERKKTNEYEHPKTCCMNGCCPSKEFRWMEDNTSFKMINDTAKSTFLHVSLSNRFDENKLTIYDNKIHYSLSIDSLKTKKKFTISINNKTYTNVIKLYNYYTNGESTDTLFYNKEFGILNIYYKTGKSISLL